jgi:hypothetical protein
MYEGSKPVFVNFYEAQELIPLAYVAWRAGTTLFTVRFLTPIDYIFKNSSTEFSGSQPCKTDQGRILGRNPDKLFFTVTSTALP